MYLYILTYSGIRGYVLGMECIRWGPEWGPEWVYLGSKQGLRRVQLGVDLRYLDSSKRGVPGLAKRGLTGVLYYAIPTQNGVRNSIGPIRLWDHISCCIWCVLLTYSGIRGYVLGMECIRWGPEWGQEWGPEWGQE